MRRETHKKTVETPKERLEQTEELRVQQDYPELDVTDFEQNLKIIEQTNLEAEKLKQLLEKESFTEEDVDGVLTKLEEYIKLIQIVRQRIEERRKLIENHPIAPYIEIEYNNHLRLTRSHDEDEQIKQLTQKIAELKQSQKKSRDAEREEVTRSNEVDVAHNDFTQGREQLRKELEKRVNALERPLGLGFFPKTRHANRQKLKEAEMMIKIIDTIEEVGDFIPDIVTKNHYLITDSPELQGAVAQFEAMKASIPDWMWFGFEQTPIYTLIQKLGNAKARFRASQREATQTRKDLDEKNSEFRKRARTILESLGLIGGQIIPELAAIQDKFLKISSEVRETEHSLIREVFEPLGISEEDEARAQKEPLPVEAPEVIREARERSFRNIREAIRRFFAYFEKQGGRKRDDIIRDIKEYTAHVRENAFVAFNDCTTHMIDVLRDGEIKPAPLLPSHLQQRSATGVGDLAYRRKIERDLGFGEHEYPVSTALGTEKDRDGGPASAYGALYLRFSLDQIRHRAVGTLGDSLNPISTPYSLRRSSGISLTSMERQLTIEHAFIGKALFELDGAYEPKQGVTVNYMRALSYIEVQIVGPLSVSQASEIVLSRAGAAAEAKELVTHYGDAETFLRDLKTQLPHLTVQIVGEPPPDLHKWYTKNSYEQFFQSTPKKRRAVA